MTATGEAIEVSRLEHAVDVMIDGFSSSMRVGPPTYAVTVQWRRSDTLETAEAPTSTIPVDEATYIALHKHVARHFPDAAPYVKVALSFEIPAE